jgi:hypothetical protein
MESKGAKTHVEEELEGSFFCNTGYCFYYKKTQLRTEMTNYIYKCTRIDQASLNVVAQSSKLANIFQMLASFS